MSEFKLTTVEEFEAATARLLETGAKVGADSWQMRVKNQTPHCKFGEQGVCCRICSMGPCLSLIHIFRSSGYYSFLAEENDGPVWHSFYPCFR